MTQTRFQPYNLATLIMQAIYLTSLISFKSETDITYFGTICYSVHYIQYTGTEQEGSASPIFHTSYTPKNVEILHQQDENIIKKNVHHVKNILLSKSACHLMKRTLFILFFINFKTHMKSQLLPYLYTLYHSCLNGCNASYKMISQRLTTWRNSLNIKKLVSSFLGSTTSPSLV